MVGDRWTPHSYFTFERGKFLLVGNYSEGML